mgnify:CR=1 FL=1
MNCVRVAYQQRPCRECDLPEETLARPKDPKCTTRDSGVSVAGVYCLLGGGAHLELPLVGDAAIGNVASVNDQLEVDIGVVLDHLLGDLESHRHHSSPSK